MTATRFSRPTACCVSLIVLALAACGGGEHDDAASTPAAAASSPAAAAAASTPAAASSPSAGSSSTAAALVITAATPATLNGTLAKAAAQFEAGSSSETGGAPYDAAQPFCRVAAYGLVGADGKKYFLQISFRKTDRTIGLLAFGDDASATTLVRVLNPASGVAIDTANRRITFSNFVMSPGTVSITLNGTLEYITNIAPENRAACG